VVLVSPARASVSIVSSFAGQFRSRGSESRRLMKAREHNRRLPLSGVLECTKPTGDAGLASRPLKTDRWTDRHRPIGRRVHVLLSAPELVPIEGSLTPWRGHHRAARRKSRSSSCSTKAEGVPALTTRIGSKSHYHAVSRIVDFVRISPERRRHSSRVDGAYSPHPRRADGCNGTTSARPDGRL
jgi:hypothetical protein